MRGLGKLLANVLISPAVITLLAALALFGARPGHAQEASPTGPRLIGPPQTGPRDPGRVVLHNASTDRVRVEVRAGPASECEKNPLVAIRSLDRNRRWAIRTTEPVCWRREQTPGKPEEGWTAWVKRAIADREVHSERVN